MLDGIVVFKQFQGIEAHPGILLIGHARRPAGSLHQVVPVHLNARLIEADPGPGVALDGIEHRQASGKIIQGLHGEAHQHAGFHDVDAKMALVKDLLTLVGIVDAAMINDLRPGGGGPLDQLLPVFALADDMQLDGPAHRHLPQQFLHHVDIQ